MKSLTAADRKSLIRLASSLPKGDKSRLAILAGLKKSARGLSSDSVKREWRSQDSAEEQREVLGRALAGTYEVLQTVSNLAKKTEGSDTKSVQNALRSVGSAMFSVGI